MHTYLRAKDENRPFLLATAFAPDTRFVTEFESDFESDGPAEGLEAISSVFRSLGALCENIINVPSDGIIYYTMPAEADALGPAPADLS